MWALPVGPRVGSGRNASVLTIAPRTIYLMIHEKGYEDASTEAEDEHPLANAASTVMVLARAAEKS
jgi:hypothetical protein